MLRLAPGAGAHRLIDRAHLSIAYGNAHPSPLTRRETLELLLFRRNGIIWLANDRFLRFNRREKNSFSSQNFFPPRGFDNSNDDGETNEAYDSSSDFRYGRRREREREGFRWPGPGHLISASFEKWPETSACRGYPCARKRRGVKKQGRAINAMETKRVDSRHFVERSKGSRRLTFLPLIFLRCNDFKSYTSSDAFLDRFNENRADNR